MTTAPSRTPLPDLIALDGVPVEHLLAEDEGHGSADPENRIHRAVERHSAGHLGGRRADEEARWTR